MKGINFKQETLQVNQQVTELTIKYSLKQQEAIYQNLTINVKKMSAAQSKNIAINPLLSPPL